MKTTSSTSAAGPRGKKKALPAAPQPAEPEPAGEEVIRDDYELARRYAVSTKTVYSWRQNGLPCRAVGRGYEYDVAKTDPWVEAFRREAKPDESSPIAKAKIEREEARARIETLKAKRLEREEDTELANILPRDVWELFAAELIQQTRDRFMRLPKLLCKLLPAKFHRIMQTEGTKEVRKICEEMARTLSEGPKE